MRVLSRTPDRLDLIDEYKFVHPRVAGHGAYEERAATTRRLELVSATPLRGGVVAMHCRRAH